MFLTWPEIHDALTHFPIAFLVAVAFFEILALLVRDPKRQGEWRTVSFWMLVVVVVMSAPALLSGWITSRTMFSGAARAPDIFTWHWIAAVATSAIAIVLLLWRVRLRDQLSAAARKGSVAVAVLGSIAVGVTGHLGGTMFSGGTPVTSATGPPSGGTQNGAVVQRGNEAGNEDEDGRGRGRGRGRGGRDRDEDDRGEDNSGTAANAGSVASKATVPSPAPDAKLVQAGQKLYNEVKCSSCHRIGGNGRTMGPDLTQVGRRLPNIEWHVEHLKNPQSVRPESTMPAYDTLTPEQLRSLSAYMVSLK